MRIGYVFVHAVCLLCLMGTLPTATHVAHAQANTTQEADSTSNIKITTQSKQGELHMTVQWANMPKYTITQQGQEILIRFKAPVDPEPFLELIRTAPDWINNVETGYDSILLHTTRMTDYTVRDFNASLVLSLRPAAPTASPQQKSEAVAAAAAEAERVRHRQRLRVTLLQARSLIDDGAYEAARADLQKILNDNPDYIEAALILAELETRAGRWRRAVAIYNRVLEKVEDPAAIQAKENLLYNEGQFLRVSPVYTKQRDSYIRRGLLTSGRIFAGPELDISFEYEEMRTRAGQVTDPNTGNTSDHRISDNRLALTAGFLLPSGQETGLSFYTTGSVSGIGAKVVDEFLDGVNTYEFRYQEPYWGAVEAIVWDGARDTLRVTHQRDIIPTLLSFNATAGLNSYQIGGEYASSSTMLNASLNLTPRLNDGLLSLYYTVDGEYSYSERELTSSTTGLTFRPFDIGRREFHTLGAFYSKDLTDYLSAEGSLSYTIDRISWGRGPGVTFGLTYRPIKPWEFGLQFSRNEVSSGAGGTTGKVHNGTAYATLHF